MSCDVVLRAESSASFMFAKMVATRKSVVFSFAQPLLQARARTAGAVLIDSGAAEVYALALM